MVSVNVRTTVVVVNVRTTVVVVNVRLCQEPAATCGSAGRAPEGKVHHPDLPSRRTAQVFSTRSGSSKQMGCPCNFHGISADQTGCPGKFFTRSGSSQQKDCPVTFHAIRI